MNQTALILIDIQNDYFPGGNIPLVNPEAAAEKSAQLLKIFREKKWPLFHVQHAMPVELNIPFLVEGTKGAEINDRVKPIDQEPVIEKTYANAFFQTDLHEQLQQLGIKKLIIVGMMTHMCVSATSRNAMELGYQVTVVSDATATRDLELHGEVVPADQVFSGNLAALQAGVANVVKFSDLDL